MFEVKIATFLLAIGVLLKSTGTECASGIDYRLVRNLEYDGITRGSDSLMVRYKRESPVETTSTTSSHNSSKTTSKLETSFETTTLKSLNSSLSVSHPDNTTVTSSSNTSSTIQKNVTEVTTASTAITLTPNITTPTANTSSSQSVPSTTTPPGPDTTKPDTGKTAPTTLPANVTINPDDRVYYTVRYSKSASEGRSYWRDLNPSNQLTHSSLVGHRRALQVTLTAWNFTYYGHDVRHITIAIGGFLYMDTFLHRFLTATQYVAPLMGNFDSTKGDNTSAVYFALFEDALVIEWRNVHLQDQVEVGGFTFQAQLYKDDGKIIFAYKKIPIPVSEISTTQHSVKAGIADAYYVDVGPYRTIYEYHNIGLNFSRITNDSAVILEHKPTCNMLKTCEACHAEALPDFTCYWCEAVGRCSDSLDRGRQEWFMSSCPLNQEEKEVCPVTTTTTATTTTKTSTFKPTPGSQGIVSGLKQSAKKSDPETENVGTIIGIVFGAIVGLLVIGLVVLAVYGYQNPTSTAGQFLIKYRPSELSHRWNNRAGSGENYRVDSQTLSNNAYEGYL